MRKCLFCDIELKDKRKKYCSVKHQQDFQFKEYCDAVDATGEFPHNSLNETRKQRAKKYLLYKYGDKCPICGIETWQGKSLVKIIDHIDGNSHNHKVENFRLICSNCDSQLPTYKSKNKNGKRSWRKKYK